MPHQIADKNECSLEFTLYFKKLTELYQTVLPMQYSQLSIADSVYLITRLTIPQPQGITLTTTN